jgi:hypothetical protein
MPRETRPSRSPCGHEHHLALLAALLAGLLVAALHGGGPAWSQMAGGPARGTAAPAGGDSLMPAAPPSSAPDPLPAALSEADTVSVLTAGEGTATVADRPADAAEQSVTEWLAALPPQHVRAVPFRTQRDGSRWAGSNCGPAALAMVLEAFGIVEDNEALRYRSHTYQGTWGMRTGTALEHLVHVAEDFGIATVGLYEGGAFRRWTVEALRAEVAAGRPVIALAKYRLLPGHEDSPVRFDHYIVLWALTPDGFVYNDPSYPDAVEGFARTITNAQLEAAMQAARPPRQAVAFLGPVSQES